MAHMALLTVTHIHGPPPPEIFQKCRGRCYKSYYAVDFTPWFADLYELWDFIKQIQISLAIYIYISYAIRFLYNIYMCTHIYICVYIYTKCRYVHVYMYICIYVYIYMYVCTSTQELSFSDVPASWRWRRGHHHRCPNDHSHDQHARHLRPGSEPPSSVGA